MRNNALDGTLKKNYIQKYQFLVQEYEEVKSKRHPLYSKVKDFYEAHGTCPQTFLKYYARYKQSGGDASALLPGKRGPKYKTRRADEAVEQQVLILRERGCNKYEVHSILKATLGSKAPSPSGVYTILKRYGKNKLTVKMKETKRQIIREKAGELAHIDCHHLSKDVVANSNQRYYIVCVVDSCTRIAWAEIIDNIQSLTVMFAVLRCFNYIADRYNIRFAEVLTDNGPEFGCATSQQKDKHPFERLLIELGVKHRYTRPYRPQTNGKAERFWRTLNDDLIEGTYFESFEQLKEELLNYMVYYNHLRPHQALGGKTPLLVSENCQRII